MSNNHRKTEHVLPISGNGLRNSGSSLVRHGNPSAVSIPAIADSNMRSGERSAAFCDTNIVLKPRRKRISQEGKPIIRSFAFLDDTDVSRLASRLDDLLIIPDGNLTTDDLDRIRIRRKLPSKKLIARINVSHIDPSSPHWDTEWEIRTPDWFQNKIQFWHPDWKALILARVEALVSLGFDGIAIEGLEAYKDWPVTAARRPLDSLMRELVRAMSKRARDFDRFSLVFPVGCPEFNGANGSYDSAISGQVLLGVLAIPKRFPSLRRKGKPCLVSVPNENDSLVWNMRKEGFIVHENS